MPRRRDHPAAPPGPGPKRRGWLRRAGCLRPAGVLVLLGLGVLVGRTTLGPEASPSGAAPGIAAPVGDAGLEPRGESRVARLELEGRTVGLALGGGAIHGAAHIGVLRALAELGVEPDVVSGTSIGALVAALHAFGLEADAIEEIALDMDWLDVASLSPSSLGLLSNAALGDLVTEALGDVRIEDAPIPLAIVAMDVSRGEAHVMREGPLRSAVMASACIPGVFRPVERDGLLLVDGGSVENVPLSPLPAMGAEVLIAVDLNRERIYRRPEDVIDVLSTVLDVAINNDTRIQTAKADLIISPRLGAYSRTRPTHVADLIRVGYEEARGVLSQALGREPPPRGDGAPSPRPTG